MKKYEVIWNDTRDRCVTKGLCALSIKGCVDIMNAQDEEIEQLKEENEKYKKHIEETVAKLTAFIGL